MKTMWSDRLSKRQRKAEEAARTISEIAQELERTALELYFAERGTLLTETIGGTIRPASSSPSDMRVVTLARLSFTKCDIAIVMPGLRVTFEGPNRT
jgi:hypothetical protein